MENLEAPALKTPALAVLQGILGTWEGETSTWFDPNSPKLPGRTRTTFTSLLDGLFLQESYQGTIDKRSHAGYRILGYDSRQGHYTCYWLDSFHTGATAMPCKGNWDGQRLSVIGQYFGGDEAWGWRTDISLRGADELVIAQYNVTPSGESALAVESRLVRTPL